ncbi:DUF3667 domain-containing protein [Chitinophaga varians]|uniref:DUF3667 domain-containing protein n=1 Tax=Chitinophaga varians TaxID=2202339 RepID=UPI00165FCE67|nr:DUF3667 domain-containing protein [Chitinophaga varians]MBC9909912.1 DUF3667 domain-containing protein [Chitinophaga varians]
MSELSIATCNNCKTPLGEKFCGHCGHPAALKRVDSHYMMHEIRHLLHFEKGLLYTIRELLLRPGHSIREFITKNRDKLVKPVIFIIITSLVYSTITHFFHIEKEHAATTSTAMMAVFRWIEGHYGYANIMMGIFIAAWLKLMFRKYRYNLFEILILLCFVMGMGMLMIAIFSLAQGVLKIRLVAVGNTIAIGYCSWAIAQFFDKKKLINYLLALVAYLAGAFSFYIVAVLLGITIDIVIKMMHAH